jgi:hypothetical protein
MPLMVHAGTTLMTRDALAQILQPEPAVRRGSILKQKRREPLFR